MQTFEELGILAAPYVDKYKDEYGRYPTLAPAGVMLLPTRYRDGSSGKMKFQMKTRYSPGDRFTVIGIEPGTRSASAVNIALHRPEDPPDTQVILTPEMLSMKMRVTDLATPPHWDKDEEYTPIDPDSFTTSTNAVTEEERECIERLRKEALVWF